jgi:hypothetical protein
MQNTSFTATPTTTSRDDLVSIRVADMRSSLWLLSSYPLYSDAGIQTSFSGFLLDVVMTPLVAFSVALTQSVTTGSILPFTIVNIDTHSAWSQVSILMMLTLSLLKLSYVLKRQK